MPDISMFSPDGVNSYNIKDMTARNDIATKQDILTAGSGIEIEQYGSDTIIKTTGATIYANTLFPSGS